MTQQQPTWAIPYSLQAEILRVLGYPDRLSSASIQLGYPNFASTLATWQPYAQLINKLAWLQNSPGEAIPIFGALHPQFGAYYVAAQFAGLVDTASAIANGAVLTAIVNGTPVSAAASGDTPLTLVQKVATAANANATIKTQVVAVAVPPVAPSTAATLLFTSLQPGGQGNGLTVALTSSGPTLLVAPAYAEQFTTGAIATGVLSNGSDPPGPSLPIDSVTFPIFGYLPIIRQLESDLGYSRRNLSAAIAADVTLRTTELAERQALMQRFQRELADRLSVPVNPDIVGNRRRGISRIV